MALQRFVPPTVLEADDVVGSDRLVDRRRRLMLLGLRRRLCHIPEGVVNARDQLWYLRRLNVALGNVSRYDLGAEADQAGLLFVSHRVLPIGFHLPKCSGRWIECFSCGGSAALRYPI